MERQNLSMEMRVGCYKVLIYLIFRNVLAAATPYFHAMFTSGLIESDFEARWSRGALGAKSKQRQKLVLQGITRTTLEVRQYTHVCNT